MSKLLFPLRPTAFALLAAALPLLAAAQNSRQDSLLRRGDLAGGRPHAPAPRTAAPTRPFVANADPGLTKFMHESVDVNQLSAPQLLDVYSRFLDATRDQRRGWDSKEWDEASATLTRLNARYEAVRLDLPLDDRLTVRSYQGEFRTLQGARRVKDRVEESRGNR